MSQFPLADADYDAVLFDLDGVLTDTARIHAKAWKRMFDAYLLKRGAARNEKYEPFDLQLDYLHYVDGKPRYDGVQSVLEARGIELPWGEPSDSPETETVCGLGNQKDIFVGEILDADGVFVFPGSRRWARALRNAGKKLAVVSSSNNCQAVLQSAQIEDLFDVRVDGLTAQKLGLPGKPAPDMFLEAARELAVEPRRAVVVEDAISGIQAGRAGNFGYVIGISRHGDAGRLKNAGADLVVCDLEVFLDEAQSGSS
jgi:beta-phosphoglucomutase family hydrolase